MTTRRNEQKGQFRLASGGLGLSSFQANCMSCRVYRLAVAAVVVVAVVVAVGHFASGTLASLCEVRFWFLSFSTAATVLVQFIRRSAVEKCRHRCKQLPRVSVVRGLLFHFALSLSQFLVYQFFYGAAMVQNLFHAFSLYIVQYPSIQFGYFMKSVRKGIFALNRELKPFSSEGNLQERTTVKEISGIHADYMILMDFAEYAVSTYSYQVLVTLAVFSLEVLFILQNTFHDILSRKRVLDKNLDFALRTYLLLCYLFKLCDVITPGERYLEECARTDVILSNISNFRSQHHGEVSKVENSRGKAETVCLQVREFIAQRMLEPSQVSILGLFQVDHRLLYAISCAAINYGLIIGMFHLGGLNKHNGFYF